MTAYPVAYPAVWLPKIIHVAELAGIKSSARDKFVREMVDIVKTAHRKADNDPAQLKYVKKTEQLIDQLQQDRLNDNQGQPCEAVVIVVLDRNENEEAEARLEVSQSDPSEEIPF